MSDESINDLASLIEQTLGIPRSQINADTSLFHDCGVAGLDGANFVEAFAARFDVDMGTFHVENYFGPELPFNPIVYLRSILGPTDCQEQIRRLSIRHLQDVINRRTWFDPPPG